MPDAKIKEIRILPPLAIGRLGSSPSPMDNYDFDGFLPAEDDPNSAELGYRKLVTAPTLVVDRQSGKIKERYTPEGPPRFRDKNHLIRPICPFLEVWAVFDDGGPMRPFTEQHLRDLGLDASAIVWHVKAVNSKAYRRTGDKCDRIVAETNDFSDHAPHEFVGQCHNFLKGKSIHMGDVQYIQPNDEFPEIRLRFTPAPGKVYGPVIDPKTGSVDNVYNPKKGWVGFYYKSGMPYHTMPGSIYWGHEVDGNWVSHGYLDDMCDGLVKLKVTGTNLETFARISVGPPDFAPDSLPVRAVSDELRQIAMTPEVSGSVTKKQAEDIIRRALETVRLMYAPAMNGNMIPDKKHNTNTNNMSVQNVNDTGGSIDKPNAGKGRAWSPLFNPRDARSITNTAVTFAHRKLLKLILDDKALPKYVISFLRTYEKVGDYRDGYRRLMPGMMRNADGMLLALTRRMQSLITAATNPYAKAEPPPSRGQICPTNQTAQLEHRCQGNPPGTLLTTAVSNNFPGLEFDYRSIWRHVFEGVTMYEAGPRVIDVVKGGPADKAGVKPGMLMIDADGHSLWADVKGPRDETKPTVITHFQTQGLEWSNAIAEVVQKHGEKVLCNFVVEPKVAKPDGFYTRKQLFDQPKFPVSLEVRHMFATNLGEGNAVFGHEIVKPGDLTQGLCSPWQNDYRECACYYWAAARPDFVNRTSDGDEITGDNWLQKDFDGHYEVDGSASKSKFVSYTDLFRNWESLLRFVIAGQTEKKPKA